MPTYQYACTDCGHAFEQFQKLSDDALVECPECSGRLRKVFNAVGVVFKGSGFYRTDSRTSTSGAPSGNSGGDSGGAGASGEKSTSSTGAKPAAASSASSSSSSSASSSSASSSSD